MTLLLVGFCVPISFAPEPGRSFAFFLAVMLYADIAFFMWFYPRWCRVEGKVEIIRLWRKHEIPVEDIIEIKTGFYFPLFWMKSFRVEYSDRGRRSYFLAKLIEAESANPKVDDLETALRSRKR